MRKVFGYRSLFFQSPVGFYLPYERQEIHYKMEYNRASTPAAKKTSPRRAK